MSGLITELQDKPVSPATEITKRKRGRPPSFRQSVDDMAALITREGPKTMGQLGYELDKGATWVSSCVKSVLFNNPNIQSVELGEQKNIVVDTDPENQKTVDFIESYLKRSSMKNGGYKEGYYLDDWAKDILLARIAKGIPPSEYWDYAAYLQRKAELDKFA